jgi:hypothetical protein
VTSPSPAAPSGPARTFGGAALVPGTPLLAVQVAGAGGGPARAAVPVREAAAAAVRALVAGDPPVVVCVGGGPVTRRHHRGAWGSLGGFGVAVDAPRTRGAGPATLPTALTVGRMLLDDAGWAGDVVLQEVAPALPLHDCASVAAALLHDAPGAAWLVVGDASAARSPRAPLGHDPRAELFDAVAAKALAEADADGLFGLDPREATDLGATGLAAWQVLASAASATSETSATCAPRSRPLGELLYAEAPFGVGYLVARWSGGG